MTEQTQLSPEEQNEQAFAAMEANSDYLSVLETNVDEVPTPKAVDNGQYTVRLSSPGVVQTSKKNEASRWVSCRFEITDSPEAPTIRHNFWLPKPDDDERKRISKMNAILKYLREGGVGTEGMKFLDCVKFLTTDDARNLNPVQANIVLKNPDEYNDDPFNEIRGFITTG